MGDASPLSAEPVGVYDDDMSGMTEDESNMSKKSRTDIPKEALVETIQKKLKAFLWPSAERTGYKTCQRTGEGIFRTARQLLSVDGCECLWRNEGGQF